jgi:uncharacterized protein YndB with AHSA1/START domain
MKKVLGIVGAVVLIGVVYVGYQYMALQRAAVQWEGPVAEIAYEKMEKLDGGWDIEFQTMFDAPVDEVFKAFSQPERAHELNPEKFVASSLKSSGDNKKTVEVTAKILNLPLQKVTMEYTFYPDEHRIVAQSINYNLADMTNTFLFEPSPDGKRTLLRYSQDSKEKLGNPLPESVQKSALKESYVNQVRTVKKGLASPGSS